MVGQQNSSSFWPIWSAFLFLLFVLFLRRYLPFSRFLLLLLVDAVQAGCSSTATPPPLHNLTNNFLLSTLFGCLVSLACIGDPWSTIWFLSGAPAQRHTLWYLAVGIGGRDAANSLSVCLSTARTADYRKLDCFELFQNRPLHLPATACLFDSSTLYSNA